MHFQFARQEHNEKEEGGAGNEASGSAADDDNDGGKRTEKSEFPRPISRKFSAIKSMAAVSSSSAATPTIEVAAERRSGGFYCSQEKNHFRPMNDSRKGKEELRLNAYIKSNIEHLNKSLLHCLVGVARKEHN
jgi:hypothetical protein